MEPEKWIGWVSLLQSKNWSCSLTVMIASMMTMLTRVGHGLIQSDVGFDDWSSFGNVSSWNFHVFGQRMKPQWAMTSAVWWATMRPITILSLWFFYHILKVKEILWIFFVGFCFRTFACFVSCQFRWSSWPQFRFNAIRFLRSNFVLIESGSCCQFSDIVKGAVMISVDFFRCRSNSDINCNSRPSKNVRAKQALGHVLIVYVNKLQDYVHLCKKKEKNLIQFEMTVNGYSKIVMVPMVNF